MLWHNSLVPILEIISGVLILVWRNLVHRLILVYPWTIFSWSNQFHTPTALLRDESMGSTYFFFLEICPDSANRSHCCHIFFRGYVSAIVVLSYSVVYYIYIYIPGKLGPCFHYWCSVYGICKWSDTLWRVGRVRLFADYTISLSSCRLIWRHWTTKMLVRSMLPSVCLRLRQFFQLSLFQYMGLCVFSLPNSPVMIVRMWTLSYYHHQTGSMNHV